jgi:alkanesulfonate monooxygenase SsuD/methylene tetrahydromethanopterin reductase-like flavin-dependent oxidoreductase (luciferase family)
MIQNEQLQNWFTYHAPNGQDVEAYARIRDAGAEFARAIIRDTPASADQTDAIRKVREAVMTANCARACGGK